MCVVGFGEESSAPQGNNGAKVQQKTFGNTKNCIFAETYFKP